MSRSQAGGFQDASFFRREYKFPVTHRKGKSEESLAVQARFSMLLLLFFILCIVEICLNSRDGWIVEPFDPKRLRLLDANTTSRTYFFRGNYPGSPGGQTVDYKTVRSSIVKLAAKEGHVLPLDFYVIDIALLFLDHQDHILDAEYWEKHPTEGHIVSWPTKGTKTNATELPGWERDVLVDIFSLWDDDDLTGRVPQVPSMLATDYGHNATVIYAHCASGVDRTGEFCGSYQMLVHGWTFGESLHWDDTIKGGRPIGEDNSKMMNFYCFWLEKHTKKDYKCSEWTY